MGAISYEGSRRATLLDIPVGPDRGPYGDETTRQIDAEIRRIMSDAHAQARRVLAERRQVLETVAARLLEKEVIDGDELRALIAQGAPGPADPSPPPA